MAKDLWQVVPDGNSWCCLFQRAHVLEQCFWTSSSSCSHWDATGSSATRQSLPSKQHPSDCRRQYSITLGGSIFSTSNQHNRNSAFRLVFG